MDDHDDNGTSLRAFRPVIAADSPWNQLSAFCLFVGYGRSGHSAIGSIIDAHPNAVVAHELNVVKRYFDGVDRNALFGEIFSLAQQQALAGRVSPRAGGGTYSHQIPGQQKPNADGITVLGDKKGAATAWQFARRGFDSIENFRAFIGLPIKMLHVIRNPFDIVGAGVAKGGSGFAELVPAVAEIRRRCAGDGWLDVYHEDVVANPRLEIARIARFLGLPVLDAHLDACAAYLYRSPNRRRLEVAWPAGRRAMVEDLIDRYAFLKRYSWNT